MANPRIRGKIPHAEWPKIAQRFSAGESLTSIARAYECTAPAIRYIVRRTSVAGLQHVRELDEDARRAGAPRQRRSTEIYTVERRAGAETPIGGTIWSNVNRDIVNFLAAVDALLAADSEQNRDAVLNATDQLLRASARTRLELERRFERQGASSLNTTTSTRPKAE